MPKKSSSKNKVTYSYSADELAGMTGGVAGKGAGKMANAVKCSDCPTPEICARKGCQREAVNKNFMGSKGKPVDLDIDF